MHARHFLREGVVLSTHVERLSSYAKSPGLILAHYPSALFLASVVATFAFGHFAYTRDWRTFAYKDSFPTLSPLQTHAIRNDMLVVSILLAISILSLMPYIGSLERVAAYSGLKLPRHAIAALRVYIVFCLVLIATDYISGIARFSEFLARYPATQSPPYLFWSTHLCAMACPIFIICSALTLHLKPFIGPHQGLFALVLAICVALFPYAGVPYSEFMLPGIVLACCALTLQSWFRELLGLKTNVAQVSLPCDESQKC